MLFENGIVNLTNWLGNVILPTLSALFFAIAIVRFVGPGQHQSWMYAGFLSLMVSGVLRALEVFSSQQAWDTPLPTAEQRNSSGNPGVLALGLKSASQVATPITRSSRARSINCF